MWAPRVHETMTLPTSRTIIRELPSVIEDLPVRSEVQQKSCTYYEVPFTFNGKINKITLDINRPKLSEEDIRKFAEGQRKAHDDQ
jgi:hypothetical protein